MIPSKQVLRSISSTLHLTCLQLGAHDDNLLRSLRAACGRQKVAGSHLKGAVGLAAPTTRSLSQNRGGWGH